LKLELTIFKSIFDNKTHRRMTFSSWEKFVFCLRELSKQPGYKPKKGEKNNPKASPLISPAVFAKDTTRSNANVIEWGRWAALDVDEPKAGEDPFARFRDSYCNVCYSTASSTPEKPKFRAVFQLKRVVAREKIAHFWYALNKEFGSVGDEQTKDLSRMYYIPAVYPAAFNFFHDHTNENLLDPDELMVKWPYSVRENGKSFLERLPEEMRKTVIEHRKEQMTNRAVYWSSYRDCPFVNKVLIKQYESMANRDGSGRYRMLYKIMTSIACNAVTKKYPITASQIANLARELDANTSRIYQKRALEKEADRALEYAYSIRS
jgi:hypothetical protein